MAKLCEGSGQWYRQHQPSARKLRKVRESCKEIIKQEHPTRLPYELCMWPKRSVQRDV